MVSLISLGAAQVGHCWPSLAAPAVECSSRGLIWSAGGLRLSCLSAPCSAETVPATAHWLAVLSSLSEWCFSSVGVLSPLSEYLSLSLPLCFGAAEFLSHLPSLKPVALEVVVELVLQVAAVHVAAALADELVPWTVVAVGESLAAVAGFAVEDARYPVAVLGLAAEGLVLVSSGCPLPAHSPLHLGPAACSLHTEDFLSAEIVCC